MTTARLLLVPAPLDFGCVAQVDIAQMLPALTLQEASRMTHWFCENAKTARAFLRRVGAVAPLACALQEMVIVQLPREPHGKDVHAAHAAGDMEAAALRPVWEAALGGVDIGLLSEAGMPAIADPGASVVRHAHTLGIEVVPLIGPVSLMLALAASGANGQSFTFHGYLPIEPHQRMERLQALQKSVIEFAQAQIFIETPYRNASMLQTCVSTLRPSTRLSVSTSLTLPNARTRSQSVQMWRNFDYVSWLGTKEPAVFVLG